jgi:hypothetical protein
MLDVAGPQASRKHLFVGSDIRKSHPLWNQQFVANREEEFLGKTDEALKWLSTANFPQRRFWTAMAGNASTRYWREERDALCLCCLAQIAIERSQRQLVTAGEL